MRERGSGSRGKRLRQAVLIGVSAVAALALLPADAHACPVCFGAAESPMIDAMNVAILLLLGVTTAVLGGFAAFFVNLMRRARAEVRDADVEGYAVR